MFSLNLGLLERLQNGKDVVKCIVDLLTHFCSRQHDLSAHEDEKHNSRLHHSGEEKTFVSKLYKISEGNLPVNQTGKQLRFVAAELGVCQHETFEPDRELHVTTSYHVLNFEVQELRTKAELLNDTSILSGSESAVVFTFGASANHLAGGED